MIEFMLKHPRIEVAKLAVDGFAVEILGGPIHDFRPGHLAVVGRCQAQASLGGSLLAAGLADFGVHKDKGTATCLLVPNEEYPAQVANLVRSQTHAFALGLG